MRANCRSCARWRSRSSITSTARANGVDAANLYDLFPHMPFRRFFERGSKDAPKAEAPTEAPDAVESADESDESAETEEDVEEGIAEQHDEPDWRDRARAVLPTGASTGSKRPEALYGA